MTFLDVIVEYKQNKNKDVLSDIIDFFMPIIITVINKYPLQERQDLQNVCVLAIEKAINRFDPNKGCKVSTYVYSYCKEYCTRYIKQLTREIPNETLTDDYIVIGTVPHDIDLQIEIQELLLENLSPLEIKIIKLKYGFNNQKTHTFKEINEILNMRSSFYYHNLSIKKLRETEYIKTFLR